VYIGDKWHNEIHLSDIDCVPDSNVRFLEFGVWHAVHQAHKIENPVDGIVPEVALVLNPLHDTAAQQCKLDAVKQDGPAQPASMPQPHNQTIQNHGHIPVHVRYD